MQTSLICLKVDIYQVQHGLELMRKTDTSVLLRPVQRYLLLGPLN
jgi:hypothetical protein